MYATDASGRNLASCGIHGFDEALFSKGPCPICREALDFALKTSRGRYIEHPDRVRPGIRPSANASNALSRAISAHQGEKVDQKRKSRWAEIQESRMRSRIAGDEIASSEVVP